MKLGISTCTYTWNFGVRGYPYPKEPFTVDRLLDKAEEFGVGAVQILENIVPLHLMKKDELKRIGARARRAGISLEIGTLGITPDRLKLYLSIAETMGAGLVRTIMDGGGAHPTVQEGAEWLLEAGREYEAAGVSIAVENHDLRSVSELKELMDLTDRPNIGVCLDMVNSLGAQECQRQVVETLLPYVINVHYKDFTIKRKPYEMGFIVDGCVAGTGMTDMDSIVNGPVKAKGDFNIILEQWMPWLGEIEITAETERSWAEKSVSYLKNHFKLRPNV